MNDEINEIIGAATEALGLESNSRYITKAEIGAAVQKALRERGYAIGTMVTDEHMDAFTAYVDELERQRS